MRFAPLSLLCGAALQAATLPLMPMPASVSPCGGPGLAIDSQFTVSLSGSGANDARVRAGVYRFGTQLSRETGIPILAQNLVATGAAKLSIVVESRDHAGAQRLGDDERYSLDVNGNRARLSADGPLGVLHGMYTFLQIVQQNDQAGFSAACVAIRDEPRFAWRGLSLDVSRHFIPADGVKRTIDGLAAVKLNVLHWHLSDDQGFRVESKKYPRLQKYGSDGQYYTQAEIRDVIEYARARGVRIVPEFDMPGHATSWLPGYPSLAARSGSFDIGRGYGILSDLIDPTKESTYRFLDGFVGEMAKLFPDDYFHIGGDEVAPKQWNESPAIRAFMHKHGIANAAQLQVYFNQRLLKIVTKHHKKMIGWDEVLQPDLPKDVVIQSWRGQKSLWQAAREGYQGILSAGYYLDLMFPASYHYSVDPMKAPPPSPSHEDEDERKPGEPQPGTPADLTPEQAKKVLGGEAAMWEELADAENIDSRLWPRLAAIAERFWSPEQVTDTTSMYERLGVVDHWLEWFDLRHHINLELMRQRLVGNRDAATLDEFASLLDPVKGYSRHADRYLSSTPLNRLVDAVAPESDAARQFRIAVRAYVQTKQNLPSIKESLVKMQSAAKAVAPVLAAHSMLKEDVPLSEHLDKMCGIGVEALGYLDNGAHAPAGWKAQQLQVLKDASNREADLLIQIAPAIEDLVNAVPD